jgi:hypothetical protein
MRTKRRLRASWVVTVGASALVGACGGSTEVIGNPGMNTQDGGDDSGNPAGCPASPPTVLSACSLPVNDACEYGNACSPTTYHCENGTWSAIIGNPPRPVCPTTPPSGACDCYAPNMTCSYAAGMCNGMPNSELATCSGGQWILSVATCNPPAPDSGVHDASVDASSTDAARD